MGGPSIKVLHFWTYSNLRIIIKVFVPSDHPYPLIKGAAFPVHSLTTYYALKELGNVAKGTSLHIQINGERMPALLLLTLLSILHSNQCVQEKLC
jgi:hypothetical protein